MNYLGDFSVGSTIYVPFATYDKDDGSSITLTGLAVTDIEIYKNGSMTQRASDAGYSLLDTDGIDIDGITGIHGFSIDTADNTTSGFFTAGADYWVVVSSVTVDGVTVNFVAAVFSLENRRTAGELVRTTIATLASQTSFTLTAGSADDNAYNGCMAVVRDAASSVQCAVGWVFDYTGSTRTVTLGVDPSVYTMATGDSITILAGTQFAGFGGNLAGTVASGTPSATAFIVDLASSSNDVYNDCYLAFLTGDCAGQVKKVTDYVGASKTITCNAFTTAPAVADRFVLIRT